VKKQKKEKKVTVIFHACAQTTHIDQFQLLPYLGVKVRSPM